LAYFNSAAAGVLVSDVIINQGRFAYTLLPWPLFENASVSFNYGQCYGLLGENGYSKVTFLQSIAYRDIEIPPHIDIYMVDGEAEPSDINAVDYIVAGAKEKVAKLEKRIVDLNTSDADGDDTALEAALEEMDLSTFAMGLPRR
jgi:ATP-binding cassette, subfamily F, member 2